MSALTDVYEITYAGRDVLVGDEVLRLATAENLGCGQCGHKLTSRWVEVAGSDVRFWLWCPQCEERVRYVRRNYRAMRSSGKLLPARLAKGNKAPKAIMRELGHHPEPFESIAAEKAAMAAEQENAVRIDDLMEQYAAMKAA